MERRFEYGGYAVLARAVPAGQGYLGGGDRRCLRRRGFGADPQPEVGVAPTAEAALAWPSGGDARAIDAGEVE